MITSNSFFRVFTDSISYNHTFQDRVERCGLHKEGITIILVDFLCTVSIRTLLVDLETGGQALPSHGQALSSHGQAPQVTYHIKILDLSWI